MLTIASALKPRAGRRKLGIALAGGGPLGFFYELGALHALSEVIEGRALTEFDVYVGVSSGSMIAAALASGFDTRMMCDMFLFDESHLVPFSPAQFMRPAFAEYAKSLSRLPKVVAQIVRRCAVEHDLGTWEAAIGPLGSLLPTAVFDNRPLEEYFSLLFNSANHSDDFRRLKARLYVVATNLNNGESVSFGGRGLRDVPISRALLASSALPGLYPPVKIRGEHYVDGALIRTMHASLALDDGCGLVLCVNPIVPYRAAPGGEARAVNLSSEGLPAILSQTFRALVHSRMLVGMAGYQSRYPRADTLLLEPDRNDHRLFFANVFRYSGRISLADHAYRCTRRDLLAQASVLAPLLARRGLRLNVARLRDSGRSLVRTVVERSRRLRDTPRRLDLALDRLAGLLPTARSG